MVIKMIGLYGMGESWCAWFRKQGDGCFSFTPKKELASVMDEKECKKIMDYAGWYCLQYSADRLVVEAA